jgi:hypothetical protein
MTTITPMAERLNECNGLFTEAAKIMMRWQQMMVESHMRLTPARYDDLQEIIRIAKNPEPS